MYILLTGIVDVYRASAAGGSQMVGSYLPGDIFGGREFFTEVYDCAYTAGADSVVYVISENSFDELSWSKPEILFEVLRAAYSPLKKISASQKTAMLVATQEPAAELKVVEQRKTPPDKQAVITASVILPEKPVEVGIFPEGHKHYPGVTKPEFARLVFPKDYDCPLCKKPFRDFRVFRSKLYESSPMRFDLRRFYTDFQTEWYDVITCHNCLFSTFHNYFTEHKPIQKVKVESALADARSSLHIDFEEERNVDFVFTSHYLALLCADGYLSLGRQIRAKLWGSLSWLYEDVGDKEMEVFSAGKAAQAYEAVYAETHLTPTQEQVTCLSIAGMQFRAGVDRSLKKFIFTAKTMKMGDKTYAKLAEDFMYELRGESED